MKKPPKPPLSDEDRNLWQKLAKTVRQPKKPAQKPVPPKSKSVKTEKGSITPIASLPDTQQPRRPATPVMPAAPRQQDDGTARQLRKGKWEIDKRIDLHGMTQAAAKTALEKFILAAARQNKRTLLVITGKGSRLAGGGVLRRMLPLWLDLPPLKNIVLALTPARAEDGGEGAFYLRLRKQKTTTK